MQVGYGEEFGSRGGRGSGQAQEADAGSMDREEDQQSVTYATGRAHMVEGVDDDENEEEETEQANAQTGKARSQGKAKGDEQGNFTMILDERQPATFLPSHARITIRSM